MHKSLFINLWITNECNMRCRYCYAKTTLGKNNMSIEKADEVISFLKNNMSVEKTLIINFHGGEPLINFDVVKYIVDQCSTIFAKTKFGITTNGFLLDESKIEYLTTHFDYNLSISLDGMRETHNHNRILKNNQESYDVVIDNALKMLQKKSSVRVRMTYDKHNIALLGDNIIHFIKLGFKTIVPVPDSFSNEWCDDDFERIELEYKQVNSFLLEKKIDDVKIQMIDGSLSKLSTCNAGEDYYSISVEGDIYPCTALVGDDMYVIGDVKMGVNIYKLYKIMNNSKEKEDLCMECQLKEYCLGHRCKLVNLSINGCVSKPDLVQCNMMNIKMKLLNI